MLLNINYSKTQYCTILTITVLQIPHNILLRFLNVFDKTLIQSSLSNTINLEEIFMLIQQIDANFKLNE